MVTVTYPVDLTLTSSESSIVTAIRAKIGDYKKVERDVIIPSESGDIAECSTVSNISDDGGTYTLSNKGWPLNIIVNGSSYRSTSNPTVTNYKFLTFDGVGLAASGTLDIWYNSFRFSDREIINAYDNSPFLIDSCGISTTAITTNMYILQTSVVLVENELRELMAEGADIKDGDTSYNISGVLRARNDDLAALKKELNDSIVCAKMDSVEGVLVD